MGCSIRDRRPLHGEPHGDVLAASMLTSVSSLDHLGRAKILVNGAMPPMSSKSRRHRSVNPTSANARQIESVPWSLLMLEDCSPITLIEKANQTSSCRGHERSFHSFILFVEVNLSIKTPLHKRYNEDHSNETLGSGAFNVTI
ncbi:hypothetical protein YC2023_030711 [Brassica napus]